MNGIISYIHSLAQEQGSPTDLSKKDDSASIGEIEVEVDQPTESNWVCSHHTLDSKELLKIKFFHLLICFFSFWFHGFVPTQLFN
jgi:hypothetical protein